LYSYPTRRSSDLECFRVKIAIVRHEAVQLGSDLSLEPFPTCGQREEPENELGVGHLLESWGRGRHNLELLAEERVLGQVVDECIQWSAIGNISNLLSVEDLATSVQSEKHFVLQILVRLAKKCCYAK